MRVSAILLSSIIPLFMSSSAFAYLTISESAEVVPVGYYQIGAESQFFTNEGGGANFSGYFDAPFSDAITSRIWLGAGQVDFTVGATAKWVPFPDVENQPAIGFRGGAFYAREKDDNMLVVQLAPIFSKKVNTENGLFIPYAAVAANITTAKSRNFTGTQFVAGSEFKHPDIPKMFFGLEAGLELNDSYSYISANVTIPFDSSKGLFE